MEQKILDKIRYEYEAFYLEILGSSRENIYANADQIVKKREISQEVEKIVDSFTADLRDALLSQPNLLDSIYLYIQEHSGEKVGSIIMIQAYFEQMATGQIFEKREKML